MKVSSSFYVWLSIVVSISNVAAKSACDAPDAPCKVYTNYPECSEKWKDQLTKCAASGCIQWIQDPFNVCKTPTPTPSPPKVDCKDPNSPCNQFFGTKAKQCSPKWSEQLDKCLKSNCVQFFQDPFNVCKTPTPTPSPPKVDCKDPNSPCNQFFGTKAKQCSPKWSEQLDKCLKSNCVQFFQDPFNVCKTATPPSPTPTKLSCEDDLNPCHVYSNYPQCSEKWKDQLTQCLATNCVQFFQDPFNVCKTSAAQSKRY